MTSSANSGIIKIVKEKHKERGKEMLRCLNHDEEQRATTILSEKREAYSVACYVKDFFGVRIPVCDIETNNKELEREILYTLFPQFD